jgi:hypothetical protein
VDWTPVAQDTVQMWQSELTSHRVAGYRETRVHTTILCQVMRSVKDVKEASRLERSVDDVQVNSKCCLSAPFMEIFVYEVQNTTQATATQVDSQSWSIILNCCSVIGRSSDGTVKLILTTI